MIRPSRADGMPANLQELLKKASKFFQESKSLSRRRKGLERQWEYDHSEALFSINGQP
jgi:hypothetical protein